jgi:hypothetical protein
MKYFFSYVSILVVFFVLQCVKNARFKLKSKTRSMTKIRGKNNKSRIKNTTDKKNGPLTWDNIKYDQTLETFLKGERMENLNKNQRNLESNPNLNFLNLNSLTSSIDSLNSIHQNSLSYTNNVKNFETSPSFISENQKSKTFRSVGPLEDSTIDNKGKKYSKLYKFISRKKIHSGYYGTSRLTR